MGCSSSKSSPVSSSVLVLGATGNIGKATVYTLKKHHVNVTAGVRDPNGKEAQEFVKQGIKVLQVDMSSEEHALSEKLKGFESILINTPGHIDRAKITINAAKAAHKAGAKYVLVISVAVIDTDILFGKQFKEIEEEIKKLGILHGFLRLPMFIDNFYMQIETLTKQGVFYGPIDGDHQFVQVAVQDAANAAAQILSHYNEFKNQAFVITSDKKSYNECAKELSSALGKEVKYVCAGYEQARASFISLHVPEWQTDGILEIYKLVDKKDPCQTVLHNAFKEITGSNPTSFSEWAKLNAAAFGGDPEKGAQKKEGILVLGASGNIGAATVRVLAQKKAHVVAGVRDPTKNNVLELEKDGAKVVKADMSQSQAELAAILAHYKAVFIVVPGAENRAQLSINAIKAAKEAKVEYILVVSLPVAGHNEILFGKQFGEIEKEVHASGLNYGILKLPMFIDNTYGNAQPIIHQNAFYGPIDGHHKFQTVSCEDAGVAAAEILIHHDKHHAKTYTIVSDVQSYDEMAHSFSQALGREIKYVNAAYEGTKKALLEHHMPEWQVDGVLELYKLIEKAPPSNAEHHDFKTITGHEPTSNENWMKKHKDSFSAKAQ